MGNEESLGDTDPARSAGRTTSRAVLVTQEGDSRRQGTVPWRYLRRDRGTARASFLATEALDFAVCDRSAGADVGSPAEYKSP